MNTGVARIARIVAALAFLALAWLAVTNAMGLALAARMPQAALKFSRGNATALAQAAIARLEKGQDAATRNVARTMAERAVRRDSTSVAALAAYGMSITDADRAGRVFEQSEALSRRNLPTQLWLIERAVSRNDIREALRHYDIALRTSHSAPGILFPILAEAVADPDLVTPLADTLAHRPAWTWLYLQQLAQSGSSLDGATRLFVTLIRRGVAPTPAALDALYDRLIGARQFDKAWALYAASHPGASPLGIRNGNFARAVTSPAPFDWVMSDTPAVSARIETAVAQRGLAFSTTAADGGDAAGQLLLLSPGAHRVVMTTGEITATAEAAPYFSLACAGSNAPIGRQPLSAGPAGRRIAWAITVPAGCPAQTLTLTIPPSTTLEGAEGSIRAISID